METKSPLEGLTPGAVQTFEAASMRDALASVKQAFGKDAIILKQEQLELGVFVTATDDLRVAQAWVDQQSDAAPRVDAKQDSQAGAPDHSSPASVVIKEPVTPPAAALGSSASDEASK